MPGIVGHTRIDGPGTQEASPVREMQRLIAHRAEDTLGEPTGRAGVAGASALHHPAPRPVEVNEYHDEEFDCWLDGEVFGLEETAPHEGPAGPSPDPGERLVALYASRGDLEFLRRADGRFAFALYDRRDETLHFATDRWGLKSLYLVQIDGELVWSSEVKGFLGHPDFEPRLDPKSRTHFFRAGQFFGTECWFESVDLVGPASVWTWDLREQSLERRQYWDWQTLEPFSTGLSRERVKERMGELFDRSVRRRCADDRVFSIGLSGGLDSRAIVAALPEARRAQSFCLTFGHPESREVRTARRVADRARLRHFVCDMDETNWFEERIRGVWLTDGEVPLQHLHSLVCLARNPEPFDVNLNGFLGGAIQGASYIGGRRRLEEAIETRGRRQVANGPKTYDVFGHARCPFMDRDLLEFTLRLPREMLADGSLYDEMLLEWYPEYFADIPDANTGRALGWSAPRKELHRALADPAREIANAVPGISDPPKDDFKYYSKWFGGPTYRETIEEILFEEPRLYLEYAPELELRPIWERICSGESSEGWELVDRALTFEIWLEQVFEDRLRPDRP